MIRNKKNRIFFYAYDGTTVAGSDPSVTGDAANITVWLSSTGAAAGGTVTELDGVNAPGIYYVDLTAPECDAFSLAVSISSGTANVLIDNQVLFPQEDDAIILEGNIGVVTSQTELVIDLADDPGFSWGPGLVELVDSNNNRARTLVNATGFTTGTQVVQLRDTPSFTVEVGDKLTYRPVATLAPLDIDGYTDEQALKLMLSVLAGKSAGWQGAGAATDATFRDAADTKDRITATTDANGNRTAVTLDAN